MRKINPLLFMFPSFWAPIENATDADSKGVGHGLSKNLRQDLGERYKPMLRQILISKMAIMMILAAIVLFTFAFIALLQGEFVPMLLAVLVLGVSVSSVYASIKINKKNPMHIELLGLITGGVILSLADPRVLDPGLAILFLVPVHMALVHARETGENILTVLVATSVFAGICLASWIPNLFISGSIISWTGAAYYFAIVAIQLYSAHSMHKFGRTKDRAHNSAVRHLAEQMGDGYVRISAEAKLLFVSEATQQLLGAQPFELMGKGLSERVHILDRPSFLKGISDAIYSGTSNVIEVRLRKDYPNANAGIPQYIWIEIFFSPIIDSKVAKNNSQVVALFRDVTGRKDHEFELIHARKKAEEASNTKSGFLATIGHELRTPLNAIVGFSEMMTNGIGGTLEPAHEEYAKLIFQSGHHLLDVVNMLLDMSKIEAGKFELQLTSFAPEDLVRPCLQMIDASAKEKGVKLVADLPINLPSVIGDERACRQMLINLLSNAVKFSESGQEILIRVKRQGQKLSISVKDTGIGMTKEAAERVGEAFFQAHDGLARQYEGTGLGLSIVTGLVELHEGTMRVESELGQGTTLTVLLPIHGPQSKFVAPELITPLITKENIKKSQPGPQPEQKRFAS